MFVHRVKPPERCVLIRKLADFVNSNPQITQDRQIEDLFLKTSNLHAEICKISEDAEPILLGKINSFYEKVLKNSKLFQNTEIGSQSEDIQEIIRKLANPRFFIKPERFRSSF